MLASGFTFRCSLGEVGQRTLALGARTGETYDERAQQYLDYAVSAVKDGYIGFSRRGKTVVKLAKAASALSSPDYLALVFESQFGHYVLG